MIPLLSGDLRPEMVEALRRVRRVLKTGCITNNLPANAIGSKAGKSLYLAEVMALFDHVIESADELGAEVPLDFLHERVLHLAVALFIR